MEPHQGHRIQKPLFMTPQSRHSEKQSVVSVFSNSSQRSFTPTRSSNLAENASSRNLADSSLHSSGFRFNTTTSRAESRSPSFQDSSSFYDTKGGFTTRRPNVEMKKEDHDIDGEKQFSLLGKQPAQNFPTEYRHSPLKTTTEEISSRSSLALLESDMTEEDLIISKMTSNHRQAKIELAKLREQNTELETRLTIKTKLAADLTRQNTELSRQAADVSHQNSELSRRIAQLKSTTKEAIDKANRSCVELRDSYEALRIQSQASSTLVNDARKTMESLEELRDATRTGLQVYLDDAGHLPNFGETRTVVHELQAELARTQQVADLLRDKLQNMGSELVDARARVTELEEHFGTDRKLIASTTSDLQRTSERVADMAEYLKLQKHETIDVLSKLAQAEDRLAYGQSRLQERDAVVHSMQQEMESMRQEISEFEEAMNDRKAQTRILQNTVTFQEQHMKDLEGRLQKAEAELLHAHSRTRDLEARLEVSKDLEKTLAQQNARLTSEGESTRERLQIAEIQLTDIRNLERESSAQIARLVSERDMLLNKLKAADAQLGDAKREEESYRERSAETRMSLKVLQERFDDQSVTLRLTKESVGDVQDRLNFANNAISTLNESLAESNNRANVLEERERSLQRRLDEANVTTAAERDLVGSLRKELLEHQIDLAQQKGIQRATEQIAEQRTREAERRIQELNSKTDSQRDELGEKQQVISELTQRLAVAETPSDQHEQELLSLKTRIHDLEQSETQLLQRTTNITVRYEQNDLNDNEWMLVQSLAQKAREVFERELVEKNNDIRRRDNLIKQHEARIMQLEASLARRIREVPQVGSSRDDKQNETFWNEPPSGHGNQQSSGVHGATNHSVAKEPRHADRLPLETLANDDSDIGEFDDEKDHATRHVKRTISLDDEESTRPARRPKNSKYPEMEKTTDKAPGPSKKKMNKRQNR
ncbi:uncharacterized protein EDB91DRAFT_1334696 [Suillus paluster]|uniref:uncharacterized protein n=1 Tax=Suillus paluster TaxID=48578 RepID=UPI001B885592|nr:uncharacterized protein EDB91DRAFT_1334696 [Suillus paluster]KAG1747741.1 hypothetical protein EDB91DRAFT_1334696 [Suillus paluster]